MPQLIPGNLLTTAMAILPHDDVDAALDLALSLDIPFWPQLPHVSYYEDMYVQAAEHFPGIILLPETNSIRFDTNKFYEELPEMLSHWEELDVFRYFRNLFRGLSPLPGNGSQLLSGHSGPTGGSGELWHENPG